MKKIFPALALVCTLFFTGCPTDDSNNGDDTGSSTLTLEVRNESSITLTDIKWNDETFGDGEKTTFTPGSIFTKAVSKSKVKNNIGYIFFTKSGLPCRTHEGSAKVPGTKSVFSSFLIVGCLLTAAFLQKPAVLLITQIQPQAERWLMFYLVVLKHATLQPDQPLT